MIFLLLRRVGGVSVDFYSELVPSVHICSWCSRSTGWSCVVRGSHSRQVPAHNCARLTRAVEQRPPARTQKHNKMVFEKSFSVKSNDSSYNGLTVDEKFELLRIETDQFFLIIVSLFIFFMQAGFAFLEAGSVR